MSRDRVCAIRLFSECLERFPGDLEVRWLLNLGHMTLGEHPQRVDPRYLLNLDPREHSECDIGRFRDVAPLVGVNRFNRAGGEIMDDFDNDGWLDLFVCGERQESRLYHNLQDGRFEEVGALAGVHGPGRLGCKGVAWIDFDNDGWQDLFVNSLM